MYGVVACVGGEKRVVATNQVQEATDASVSIKRLHSKKTYSDYIKMGRASVMVGRMKVRTQSSVRRDEGRTRELPLFKPSSSQRDVHILLSSTTSHSSVQRPSDLVPYRVFCKLESTSSRA